MFLGGHVRGLMDLFQAGPSQASITFQPTILVERSGEEGRKSNPLWGHFPWSLGLHKDTCPPVPVSAPLVNKQASRGKIIFSKSSSSWFLAPNWSFFFFFFFFFHCTRVLGGGPQGTCGLAAENENLQMAWRNGEMILV